ncbi:MAG: nucleotidyltransferase family protein [Lachnospiraceae bacterium]|nr:nucleotidyltransferase family protein [Lachnospiraceae bacterium]
MKTIGIIAEFNPFHNGHRYILEEAKKRLQADYCVVVMSGSFVQRGAPACMYKYDRVRAALSCGADAVLELPVSYATASAEAFAHGGVSILDSLSCIDAICFGAECDDIDRLSSAAGCLIDQPEDYKAALEWGLSRGLSFPAARAEALPQYSDILSSPNNILAVEYLKALKRIGSDMTVCPIQRIGAGYHATSLSGYTSAEAIRSRLEQTGMCDDISESIPYELNDLMSKGYKHTYPVTIYDMTLLAEYMLLTHSSAELAEYQDMNPDLANRMLKTAAALSDQANDGSGKPAGDFGLPDLIGSMRTKEMTYTRLSRAMLHCILGLKDMTRDSNGDLVNCPYTRILGFRSEASGLMHAISSCSRIPPVNKAGDAHSVLSADAYSLFDATIRADRIYDMILRHKFGTRLTDGCRISPIIL